MAYEMRISDWSSDVCCSDRSAASSWRCFGLDLDEGELRASRRGHHGQDRRGNVARAQVAGVAHDPPATPVGEHLVDDLGRPGVALLGGRRARPHDADPPAEPGRATCRARGWQDGYIPAVAET